MVLCVCAFKIVELFSCLFLVCVGVCCFFKLRFISTCPNCARVYLCFCEQQNVQMVMNKNISTYKHLLQIYCQLHALKFILNTLTTEIHITIQSPAGTSGIGRNSGIPP